MRTFALRLSLVAGMCVAASSSFAVTASPFEVFTFDGICTDCTTVSHGTATLTLMDYAPGSTISSSNFVEFDYSGDITYQVTGPVNSISGNISSDPGFYNFSLEAFADQNQGLANFSTDTSGNWTTGLVIADSDHGDNGTWNGTPVVSGVPELSTWLMILLGFSGLGLFACRRASKGGQAMSAVAA